MKEAGEGTRLELARAVAAVMAAANALPDIEALAQDLERADAACARGYFLPDEEELIRRKYHSYLVTRSALLEVLDELARLAGTGVIEWRERLPVFATAFAAACLLMRANRFVVDLAAERPVVWSKLDEADERSGVPRKTFTALYRAISLPANLRRFLMAAEFYFGNREEIRSLKDDPGMVDLVDLLTGEEPFIERRRRAALKRLFAYRWFSFLRRHRSAWKKVMFGMFEVSGRAIADLRQPGIKLADAPKRISPSLVGGILKRAKPGDVFVTRHDDALSNWFLPGFWPHAALYLGTAADLEARGIELPPGVAADGWFLESKKDGVRLRPAGETLQVDAFVVMRPPLEAGQVVDAISRAMRHVGKPYDFLFDFRTADRLACTEVIYRGFHGIGPIGFHLEEVGGRLCLPAEEFLNQALDCGFRVVATGGLRGDRLLYHTDAEVAFHGSRQPL
ncbi:MAG: YiiX/YebB-like N1pC/P60 family cysteine hydrolase [Akkermansiaceae bacterium]